MKASKLSPKEKKEMFWVTVGRLRTAIKMEHPTERKLALFEKIVKEIEDLDIKIDLF